jgi:hypothetical protein
VKRPAKRFGLLGEKRRYTVSTYLSNRSDVRSHKPHSTLTTFTRYSEDRFTDYRTTTDEERKAFVSPIMIVFRKRKETRRS